MSETTTHKRFGDRLPHRHLGRSELLVPALALGGHPLGVLQEDEGAAIETVQYAVEQGVHYVDTSPGYGESERRIGLALEGVPRASMVISTKTGSHPERTGDYSWDGTMWSVENSLRMLKTDYIDLVLVHDPPYLSPDGMTPVMEPGGALEALERLKDEGVIKAIGLGQKWFHYHKLAIESDRFDVILTFNNYNLLDVSAADWLLPLARRYDVGVLNGSPMAHGLLSGEDPDAIARSRTLGDRAAWLPMARTLYQWCQTRDIPMRALVFQFCIRQPLIHCTLTGAKSREELEQNLRAATMPLPPGVWDEVAALGLTRSRYHGQPPEAREVS